MKFVFRFNRTASEWKIFSKIYENGRLCRRYNYSICANSIFKRELPKQLVPLNSVEGKRLFQEAWIENGSAEAFFPLVEGMQHQREVAYCGLTCISVVLNASNSDPLRGWKHPWRWWDENMLECCIPLNDIRKEGLSADQFLCVATCNSGNVSFKSQSSLDEFREDVIKSTQLKDNTYIVSAFSRQAINQTGEGHYAIIAAYNKKHDMVLLLEPAKFKYPNFWVALADLWESMRRKDPSTDKSRGYFIIKGTTEASDLIKLLQNGESFRKFMKTLLKVPFQVNSENDDQLLVELVTHVGTEKNFETICKYNDIIAGEINCEKHQSKLKSIISDLQSLSIYQALLRALHEKEEFKELLDLDFGLEIISLILLTYPSPSLSSFQDDPNISNSLSSEIDNLKRMISKETHPLENHSLIQ